MAQLNQSKLSNAKPSFNTASSIQQQQKQANAMFHDFFEMTAKNTDASPSASISAGAASSGHPSTTSEKQAGNHLEGIPFYGRRNGIPGLEKSNRLAGSKRSNSDSAFTGSTKDRATQIGHDSFESLHSMKMLKSGSGAKSDRSTPQYPPRAGQFANINKFRDMNATGPSVVSQSAADEGSRNGIKGPVILSSINAPTEKIASPSSRPGIHVSEPESSILSNRQMTIFYGGQAHVFDEVHTNKADVIMALAGSNGGSWSTTYSTIGQNEASIAAAIQREIGGRLQGNTGNTNRGLGSGVHLGSIEDKRKQIQVGASSEENTREG